MLHPSAIFKYAVVFPVEITRFEYSKLHIGKDCFLLVISSCILIPMLAYSFIGINKSTSGSSFFSLFKYKTCRLSSKI